MIFVYGYVYTEVHNVDEEFDGVYIYWRLKIDPSKVFLVDKLGKSSQSGNANCCRQLGSMRRT